MNKTNRVPKFRVWDLRTNNWISYNNSPWNSEDALRKLEANEFFISGDGKEVLWNEICDSSFTQQGVVGKEVILQQFTGLLDKNGREIFEGDIVNCQLGGGVEIYQGNIGFSGGAFWLQGKTSFPILQTYAGELELVGNIFENPEILTEV